MQGHYCVRVYANGDARHTIRDAEGKDGWVEYNRRWRPGNALFVDGAYLEAGYLDTDSVALIEAKLRAELAAGRHDLGRPERMATQYERIGGRTESYFGYPAEAGRSGFRRVPQEERGPSF